MSIKDNKFQYDVIFSLAGEQKNYVDKVSKYLTDNQIKVWFYGDREVELWGKNQIDAFSELFTKNARYCVIFISKEYTQKIWPNLERQFIQSRWLKDPEYLLPARFDDSLVIGIPDAIGYINISGLTPEEFGKLLVRKIKGAISQETSNLNTIRIPKVNHDFDPLEVRNEWIFSIIEDLKERCNQVSEASISHDEIEGVMHIRIRYKGNVIYSLNIYKKAYSVGDSGISFYGTSGEMDISGGATNAFGNFIWSKEKEEIILKLLDMSLIDMLSGEKEYTKMEFIDALWNKICDIIENNY